MRVIIKNWKVGFNKISFSKLLMSYSNISLNQAKEITDRILENEEVSIWFDNEFEAKEFIERATGLGVIIDLS